MKNFSLTLLIVLISVLLNIIAQSSLKLGSGQNPVNIYIGIGLCSYALSTIFYIMVLGKLNLSVAYPIIIGLTIIGTTLSGSWFFKEEVLTNHWIGIGLIISGVSAIAFGKIYN